jgi:glycosyltransferase involved in cell wall biosynthesis
MAKKQLMKLNLGCGRDKKEGWVNLDIDTTVEPDVLHDLSQPLPFLKATADEVLAQDILEHFTFEDVDTVIAEISRVLIEGGVLTVRVPSVNQIISQMTHDHFTRNHFLYGDTSHTGVFGAHKVGYTPESLTVKMLQHNLRLVSFEVVETNYLVHFIKETQIHKLKKILFMTQTLGVGGAEVFDRDLLVSLKKNLQAEVTAYTNYAPFQEMLNKAGISTHKIPYAIDVIGDWKGLIKGLLLIPVALLFYCKVLWQNRNTDLLLMSGFPDKLIAAPLARFFSFPQVWIEFGPLNSVLNKFFRLPKIWYRLVGRLPEIVVVPSKHTLRDLVTSAQLSLSQLRVIPCGGQTALLKAKEPTRPTIVCVSRLEPGKGQDLLIQAFALIIKKIPSAKLLIVGEGSEYKKQLEALTQKLQLEKSVEFLGRVANSLEVMSRASVCVFPSLWNLEGFGMVTIEAMSLGKPIVAFDYGPTAEILTHNQTGLLAPAGNREVLAEQILRILKDEKLAKKLGKNAQLSFNNSYMLEKVTQKYVQVLHEAIFKKQARQILKKLEFHENF